MPRHARILQALADKWCSTEPSIRVVLSHLLRDLRNAAEDQQATEEWLAKAMESSWAVAAALMEMEALSDLLGERHRIIANDWQAATMNTVQSHLTDRAADIPEHVDFTPAALRADLPPAASPPGCCTPQPR